MKKALLILAVAFAALQTAQPANAYYPYGGGQYGGGPANFMPVGGPGMYGGGGPGMFGGYYGRPGFFGGYHHCYRRHWRRW